MAPPNSRCRVAFRPSANHRASDSLTKRQVHAHEDTIKGAQEEQQEQQELQCARKENEGRCHRTVDETPALAEAFPLEQEQVQSAAQPEQVQPTVEPGQLRKVKSLCVTTSLDDLGQAGVEASTSKARSMPSKQFVWTETYRTLHPGIANDDEASLQTALSEALDKTFAADDLYNIDSRRSLERRLVKVGYDPTTAVASFENLSKMISLLKMPCILTRDKLEVEYRDMLRGAGQASELERVNGFYEVNLYLADRAKRFGHQTYGDASLLESSLQSSTALDGFNKEFIELAVGMSFFKLARVAHMAANDFLHDPILMMAAYLELSAAAKHLAASGQLSLALSDRVNQLAGTLELAPAACLDCFDSMFLQIDADGERAGFSMSGHLLRNERLRNHKKEGRHLPLTLMRPLAVLQVAVDNEQLHFISQPVVHKFMRAEFVGGGMNELHASKGRKVLKVAAVGFLCWPLLLCCNVAMTVLVAIFPPLESLYESRVRFHKLQTHERIFWGACFLPVYKYIVTAIGDFLVALAFTESVMMPFAEEEGSTGLVAQYDWWYAFAWIYGLGSIVDELGILYETLYHGIDMEEHGIRILRVVTERFVLGLNWLSKRQSINMQSHASTCNTPAPSTVERTPRPRSTRLSRSVRTGRRNAARHSTVNVAMESALTATMRVFSNRWRLKVYLSNRLVDLVARVLCVLTIALANTYTTDDRHAPEIGALSKEAILSYTVVLLWLRLIKILQITSHMGSFVYMLGAMLQDVLRWVVIFMFCAIAFAAGLFILLRNARAPVGARYVALHEDCDNVDVSLDTFGRSLLILVKITLTGSDLWECFQSSSASVPALLLFGSFLVVVVLVLLNTLIATMAETYGNVSHASFANYAFSFAKVLLAQRRVNGSIAPVPLNVLSVPYRVYELISTMGAVFVRTVRLSLKAPSGPPDSKRSYFTRKRLRLSDESSLQARGDPRNARPRDASAEDDDLIKQINEIRCQVIMDPKCKQQFERSIARFCSLQDDQDDPVTLTDIREIIQEERTAQEQEGQITDSAALVAAFEQTKVPQRLDEIEAHLHQLVTVGVKPQSSIPSMWGPKRAEAAASTSDTSPAVGVDKTEYVVKMLISLGAKISGKGIDFDRDVAPLISRFETLDADGSGNLSLSTLVKIHKL